MQEGTGDTGAKTHTEFLSLAQCKSAELPPASEHCTCFAESDFIYVYLQYSVTHFLYSIRSLIFDIRYFFTVTLYIVQTSNTLGS